MRKDQNKSDSGYNQVATIFTVGGVVIFTMFVWAFFSLSSIG
jgi:hypothetical protein